VLREFAQRGLNLKKLESRPIPGQPFRYRFYLDVEGHASSDAFRAALAAIAPHTADLRLLGTYPAALAG
jgi:chorismate mutase/prephenate dehydratase